MQAFGTVDQAAGDAVAMLREGERLSRLWRYVFVQMLDDYTSVLRHAGVPAAARMWATAPRSTGDIRVDAAFAAMAEYLARRDGWDMAKPEAVFIYIGTYPSETAARDDYSVVRDPSCWPTTSSGWPPRTPMAC